MKVFVPPTMLHFPTKKIFEENGYSIVDDAEGCDLIVLTGGEDISPLIYGQVPHPTTSWNHNRDSYEISLYEQYNGVKAFVGICRGAQLLCALNDGDLIQDLKGNHPSQHMMKYGNELVVINSYHHQACVWNDDLFEVIATPYGVDENGDVWYHPNKSIHEVDVPTMEIFRVKGERVMGCQYHPELSGVSKRGIEVFFEEVDKTCAG